MNEASKTRAFRGQAFIDRYFGGNVLDIGCGPDLVVPGARPFDHPDGDANCIADYLPAQSFDCVHSSHCLEHMKDVPKAVQQWWSLVKPGGVMIIAVPEENLYEQGFWPSIFNTDHKATFRLGGATSWSPVSYDLRKLVEGLPDAEVVAVEIQDTGYDHRWERHGLSPLGRVTSFFRRARRSIFRRVGISSPGIHEFFEKAESYLGMPIDQTRGNAMAQIQAVVTKRTTAAPAR